MQSSWAKKGFFLALLFLNLAIAEISECFALNNPSLKIYSLSADSVGILYDAISVGALPARGVTLRLNGACDGEEFSQIALKKNPRRQELFFDAPIFSTQCRYQAFLKFKNRRKRRISLTSNLLQVDIPADPSLEFLVQLTQVNLNSNLINRPSDLKLGPNQTQCPSLERALVLEKTNYYRQKAGLAALSADGILELAANTQSVKMASLDLMTHQGWFDTLQALGYPGLYMAQNIASDVASPTLLVDFWMSSPEHRANILNPKGTKAGVGCVIDGSGRKWWTEDFGG